MTARLSQLDSTGQAERDPVELQTCDPETVVVPSAEAVLLALTGQGGPRIRRLRVGVEEGVVTARGYVESHGQKFLAHQRVGQTSGGRQVQLLLAVLCDQAVRGKANS